MKSEKIFEAMTEIDEEYVAEAESEKIPRRKKLSRKVWGAAAACAVTAIAIGTALSFLPMGASAGSGTNREPGSEYMSYAGPAFPLTALENTQGLTFERNIDFDFSPYYTCRESYKNHDGETVYYDSWDNDAVIHDNYVVTNTTDRDITFTAVYPFAGNISTSVSKIPQITVDGKEVETNLVIGQYSGGFSAAWGDEDGKSESLNLSSIESWYEYKALLENGEYQKEAFSENPKMEQPVKVYSFEIEYNIPMAEFDEIDNPDAIISFDYNANKTDVLLYGFNYMSWNDEEKWMKVGSGVPKSFNPDYEYNRMYIIVLNGDIENIETKSIAGYVKNSWDEREETAAFSVTTEKYESTLEDIILEIISSENYSYDYGELYEPTVRDMISDEEYLGYVAEFMFSHGQLSENLAERYCRSLDDIISEVGHVSRVLYVTFETTVPAGESIEIKTNTVREASYDFFGKRNKEHLEGFDLVTKLGTNLNIIKQTASVSNTEEIEIVYNNFGFDSANGITSVILGEEEHYWMEICKIKAEKN